MNKRYVYSGLGLLALVAILLAGGFLSHPVTLKTGSLYPDASPGFVGCYTSGVEGDLVTDSIAGTAIIDRMNGHRVAVTWPPGYTGRSSGSEVEVLNTSGKVVTRTGTLVNMPGGYWTDGTFLACGNVIPNY
jgi:hypothetical protein